MCAGRQAGVPSGTRQAVISMLTKADKRHRLAFDGSPARTQRPQVSRWLMRTRGQQTAAAYSTRSPWSPWRVRGLYVGATACAGYATMPTAPCAADELE